MEHLQEKQKFEEKGIISEEGQDIQSVSPYKRRRQNKKIKKIRHRKKGTISKQEYECFSIINDLLKKNDFSFNKTKGLIKEELKAQFMQKIHVRDIIYPDQQHCFGVRKEGLQKEVKNYRELIRMTGEYTSIQKIGLKAAMRGKKMYVNFLRDLRDTQDRNQMNCRQVLSSKEVTLISKREQIMSQIVTFANQCSEDKGYPPPNFDEVLMEILTLCKLNTDTESQIIDQIDKFTQKEDFLFNCHQEVSNGKVAKLRKELTQGILIKNLMRSFNEEPIDFLNYHKRNEYYEDNGMMETEFRRLTDLDDFKRYAGNKKPKSRKNSNYLLRTPCSACFSEIAEFSNPILNCPECHMRVHQNCQEMDNRCHRCRYGRTGNKEKLQTSYCYICNRDREKGAMIQTVTSSFPHRYAHNYCLLLHHFWTVQKESFIGQYVKPLQNRPKCIFCNKNQGHFFTSSCCSTSFHGMCAYLEGCSFQMKKEGYLMYKIQISCCKTPKERERLAYERKFKLNIQKLIFREDKELFEFISETIGREEDEAL